jgi:hypothetical protein
MDWTVIQGQGNKDFSSLTKTRWAMAILLPCCAIMDAEHPITVMDAINMIMLVMRSPGRAMAFVTVLNMENNVNDI